MGKPQDFKKDDPRINREGRPVGTRNFQTDFDEVVEEIAKANNITNSEARKILIKKAYGEAKDGNFQYYKELVDRVYGKVPEEIGITIKPQPILDVIPKNNSDPKDNGAIKED